MLKIGVALAVPLLAGFIFLPQLRVVILGLAPFALFALCPLSMIFCMKGMMGDRKQGGSCANCDHKDGEHKLAKNRLS